MIERRNRWGQWLVYCVTEEGLTVAVRESWTDAAPRDLFVKQAHGRAIARTVDLLELARMAEAVVKGNTPNTLSK
jgi:hypothetical protein